MTMRIGVAMAATIAGMAAPAAAAQEGAVAAASRGAVAITVSVAPQARLTDDAAGVCLWSNTATRLLAVAAEDDAVGRPGDDAIVASPTPGCASGGRLTLAALPGRGGMRTILVSPE